MRSSSLPQPQRGGPSLPQPQRGGLHIRRFLTPFLAVFIVAAVLIASTPVDAAPRKVKLGISMTEGNRNTPVLKHEMDEFKNETGAYPAIWTLWSTWGNSATKKFPMEQVKAIKAKNAVPLIFWEPAKNRNQCTDHSRLRKIKNGKFDGYIKQWARQAKKSKSMILLRFAHEINGRYFPWTIGQCGNKISHYKAAWKRVHNIIRNKIKAKNVKMVWTVAKRKSNGGNQYKPFYPGNPYVQFVGYSAFNWGAAGQWASMVKSIDPTMKKFKQFTKKPVIIAELGSNSKGGPTGDQDVDKPNWIKNGYMATYKKYPQIKAVVWLNEDLTSVGHPDWSLNDPNPEAMNAYDWVVDKKKNGKYIFRGRFR